MNGKLTVGLIGAGILEGDVHLRTDRQLAGNGLAPWLGRGGLDDLSRVLADVEIEFAALAAHTPETLYECPV